MCPKCLEGTIQQKIELANPMQKELLVKIKPKESI